MKARTKVPASLLRDLKRDAWNDHDAALAELLLMFDPDTDGDRTPMNVARQLVAITQHLAKEEDRLRNDALESTDHATTNGDGAPLAAHVRANEVLTSLHFLRCSHELQRRL